VCEPGIHAAIQRLSPSRGNAWGAGAVEVTTTSSHRPHCGATGQRLRSVSVFRLEWRRFLRPLSAWMDAAVVAVSLLGGGFATLFKPPWWLTALVALLLFLLYLLASSPSRIHDYTFKKNSEEMASFFRKWYSQAGKHLVFCDDLDWMKGSKMAPIAAALSDQGGNVTICLRTPSGEIVDDLQQHGAHVCTTAPRIETHTKFSICTEDGDAEMIVRVKSRDNSQIRFRRVSDRFSVGLARDLVRMSSGDGTVI
jgi:hypothetical protein